ncbi:MAG: hypothetical protein IPL47_13700 [Phyllobacteriaceae bacterium]|nr:hypothetical protein [Phyllobacteriaceae bacterium]
MPQIRVLRHCDSHPALPGISRFDVNRRRFDFAPAADGGDLVDAALCEVVFAIEDAFGVGGDDPRLVAVMGEVRLAIEAARIAKAG